MRDSRVAPFLAYLFVCNNKDWSTISVLFAVIFLIVNATDSTLTGLTVSLYQVCNDSQLQFLTEEVINGSKLRCNSDCSKTRYRSLYDYIHHGLPSFVTTTNERFANSFTV